MYEFNLKLSWCFTAKLRFVQIIHCNECYWKMWIEAQ